MNDNYTKTKDLLGVVDEPSAQIDGGLLGAT
jgi:hypothetical protein